MRCSRCCWWRRGTRRCARSNAAAPVGCCWPRRSSGSGSSPRCCWRSSCCPRADGGLAPGGAGRVGTAAADLALAAVALVVSAGWWVLVVELWPAADRPYIGGSQDNSVLELVFGYDGFGRLTGDEVGSVGGGAGGVSGGWGETGLTRLLGAEFGGQASWLLPAAL